MKRAKATEHPVRHSKRKRFSCQECVDVDDEDMFMCDICDRRLHYSCAGVGPKIANSCQKCVDIEKYIYSTGWYWPIFLYSSVLYYK